MQTHYPPLLRGVLKVALLLGIVAALWLFRPFLVVFSVAALLAMLFDPLQNRLEHRGWSRGWSTAACTLVLVLIFAGVCFLLGQQVVHFIEDWPRIQRQGMEQLERLQEELFGTIIMELPSMKSSPAASGQGQPDGNETFIHALSEEAISGALLRVLSILGEVLLMFVYFVLLLAEKDRLREFVVRRFPPEKREQAEATINKTVEIAAGYLRGRLLLMLILAVAHTIGFYAFGVPQALFLAALTAVISLIPYIGNFMGGGLAVLLAMLEGASLGQLYAIVVIISIWQQVENYVLTPLIIGKNIDLNPFFSIAGAVVFLVVWGAVGAIIALPVIAIFKVVADNVPQLRDYGFLMGEDPVKPPD